jgi:hypothetical protein
LIKLHKTVFIVFLLVTLSFLPFASATITFGNPLNASQSVTLINPDNSSLTFTNLNYTTYGYASNAPDGWWNLVFTGSSGGGSGVWILVVLCAIFIGVPLLLLSRRKR